MRLIVLIFLLIWSIAACTFDGDESSLSSSSTPPSSSSVKKTESSSSSFLSSSSYLDCSIISSSSAISKDLCSDFDQNSEIKHYGKMKKQFCDERDGKKYVYVQIGEHTWMAENLNYDICGSKCGIGPYGDGMTSLTGANTEHCDKFGRLYDWATAMALPAKCNSILSSNDADCAIRMPYSQGICPVGWHIPNNEEWTALMNYAGDFIGVKLRASSKDWFCIDMNCIPYENPCPNRYKDGTDDYGFSALPGGYGDKEYDYFDYGFDGNWWSNVEVNRTLISSLTIRDHLKDVLSDVLMQSMRKEDFLSARCVKDY